MRATAPLLLDVARTKPCRPVPYKSRHTLILCVCWHISIGTLVTHYIISRTLSHLNQSRSVRDGHQAGFSEEKDQKVPEIFIVQAAPLIQYIETNKSVYMCVFCNMWES